MSFVTYEIEPPWPATDQNPAAVRERIGNVVVDWWGAKPTPAEVAERVSPSAAQEKVRKRSGAKAMLGGDSEAAIFRRALLRLLKPANVPEAVWLQRFHDAVDAES